MSTISKNQLLFASVFEIDFNYFKFYNSTSISISSKNVLRVYRENCKSLYKVGCSIYRKIEESKTQ